MKNLITLAIGDGANDVNMINAAHIGIGIEGVEGTQAARAADYSIGEFRILKRLLFYWGRENYRRNANLILYNFYKNVIFVMPTFLMGIYMYFSGSMVMDILLIQFYNTLYTPLPIILYALFDEEFPNSNVISFYFRLILFWF